jgi:hypothetical protein
VKKKVMALLTALMLVCVSLTGCTEAYKVSNNISQEADNFNVTRKLTVLNTRRIWSISMIIQCTLLKTFPVLM